MIGAIVTSHDRLQIACNTIKLDNTPGKGTAGNPACRLLVISHGHNAYCTDIFDEGVIKSLVIVTAAFKRSKCIPLTAPTSELAASLFNRGTRRSFLSFDIAIKVANFGSSRLYSSVLLLRS